MNSYTTIKEFDNAVRASQRKIKGLNERLEANPLDGAAQQSLELAKAGHRFLLASRAKFKETGVNAPKLRDVQAAALEEGSKLAQGVDPGAEPGLVVYRDEIGQLRAKPAPNAAMPQEPTPVDRSREFIPRARVVRERVNAGPGARVPRFAPDDSRNLGLGYRTLQRRAEQKRFVMSLGITPKFPSERYPTQRMSASGSARITVNGQAW